jgi:hypothetical protein
MRMRENLDHEKEKEHNNISATVLCGTHQMSHYYELK